MSSEVIEVELSPIKEIAYKDNTNWGSYGCDSPNWELLEYNQYGNISIVGMMPRLILKANYKAQLVKTLHPRFGVTYQVKAIEQLLPSSVAEQKAYLSSLLTENQVYEIYKVYPNEDIIQLFQDNAFDYRKVKGIGEKTYEAIRAKVLENLNVQKALAHLSKYNITYKMILKLINHYQSVDLAIQKVENNPYVLATEVSGIGFLKADTIAQSMSFDMESPFRIRAGIQYVIEQEQFSGHTYIFVNQLVETTKELLNVTQEMIVNQINEHDGIIISDDRIALKETHQAEKYVANRIKTLLEESTELEFDVEKFVKEQEAALNIKLTDQQKNVIYNIKKHNISLLIGFAGTGKTQMQKLLINLLKMLRISYRLLSPTGKAAKIFSNYVGETATTIHRAIGFDLKGEIHEQFVIIDEFSMSGVNLTSKLLKNCKHPNLRLLFVGDAFQLPSVEAGNLLHDMITSGAVPVSELNQVFRQEEGGILDVATKIRQGKQFIKDDFVGGQMFGDDLQFYSVPQEKMIGGYRYAFNELTKTYDPDDVMLLSSTKKGTLGTISINSLIQEIINPSSGEKSEYEYGNGIFYRTGDLIINTKNLYQVETVEEELTDVVNGDIGKIIEINTEDKKIIVDYGFAVVPVKFNELDTILHANCITIHKSQGSASRAVIALFDKSHTYQLNANLIYTAITRAKEFCFILCQANVMNRAIKKVANMQRNTFLKELLISQNE